MLYSQVCTSLVTYLVISAFHCQIFCVHQRPQVHQLVQDFSKKSIKFPYGYSCCLLDYIVGLEDIYTHKMARPTLPLKIHELQTFCLALYSESYCSIAEDICHLGVQSCDLCFLNCLGKSTSVLKRPFSVYLLSTVVSTISIPSKTVNLKDFIKMQCPRHAKMFAIQLCIQVF